MDVKQMNVHISGRVQGVGYRYFAQEKAIALGLTGWVRNLPNGDVEATAQGSKEALTAWLKELERGPAFAKVLRVAADWQAAEAMCSSFDIH
jgi:acylphosphatase